MRPAGDRTPRAGAPVVRNARSTLQPHELEATLREWVRVFNSTAFYEAHEVVEEAWHLAAEPERTFLKGLVHVSVSLAHYQRGNRHGAVVKGRSAARYLAPYGPEFRGLRVSELLQELERFLEPAEQLPPGSPLPEPEHPWPRALLAG